MNEISRSSPREVSPWRIERNYREAVEPDLFSAQQAEEVHLRDYWKILLKRRKLAILVFASVVLLGAYFNFTATKVYTATATLKIEPQNPTVTGVREILPASGGSFDYYVTQYSLLKSRALAAKAIQELGLESNEAFRRARVVTANPVQRLSSGLFSYIGLISWHVGKWMDSGPRRKGSPGEGPQSQRSSVGDGPAGASVLKAPNLEVNPSLIGRYLGFLDVRPVRNTRLVQIRFTTPDPSLSQLLANHHATAFIRMNLEDRFYLSNEAREFLEKKNAELKAKLQRSEEELNRFRQQHGVVSLDKGENIVVDRLVDLNRQLTAARAQRIEAESLYRTVQNKNYQDLSEIMRQGLVPQLRSNVASLETEKARLSGIFKPDHPRIQELNQQIADAKRALNAEIASVVRTIESNFVAARAREEALQAEANRQQQLALSLKEVGVQYLVLQEEVNVNRSLYESVLKRLSETNVSNDLAVSNMQVSERAEKPLYPSSPSIPMNLILYAFFGALFSVGLVFFVEYLDSTVSTADEVWRAVFLNTLGVVPSLHSLRPPSERSPLKLLLGPFNPSGHSRGGDLIIAHDPRSIIAESFHSIRTALLLSQAEKPPQVILVTSPLPGEGKTMTTINLAISLAHDGHKVLLIDADLRRGCCHRRLGVGNNRGLSNILAGKLSLEEGVQATPVEGLSLLSRGVPAPNPAALLGSRKMKETLMSLRESYDFIFLDSPPVIALGDAALLSSICEGVILVLDGQKTTAAAARQAVERLNTVHARILGVVLNSVDVGHPDYAYYRHYYAYSSEVDVEKADDAPPASPETNENERPTALAKAGGGGEDAAEPREERGSPRVLQLPATVPPEFFKRVSRLLAEAMGPMAGVVLRERIASLGELQTNFPTARLEELLTILSKDILDERLRAAFERGFADEVRGLYVPTADR